MSVTIIKVFRYVNTGVNANKSITGVFWNYELFLKLRNNLHQIQTTTYIPQTNVLKLVKRQGPPNSNNFSKTFYVV